jgi:hypothetical protein
VGETRAYRAAIFNRMVLTNIPLIRILFDPEIDQWAHGLTIPTRLQTGGDLEPNSPQNRICYDCVLLTMQSNITYRQQPNLLPFPTPIFHTDEHGLEGDTFNEGGENGDPANDTSWLDRVLHETDFDDADDSDYEE